MTFLSTIIYFRLTAATNNILKIHIFSCFFLCLLLRGDKIMCKNLKFITKKQIVLYVSVSCRSESSSFFFGRHTENNCEDYTTFGLNGGKMPSYWVYRREEIMHVHFSWNCNLMSKKDDNLLNRLQYFRRNIPISTVFIQKYSFPFEIQIKKIFTAQRSP